MLIRIAFDWEYFKIFFRILPACINKNNDLSFVSSLEKKRKIRILLKRKEEKRWTASPRNRKSPFRKLLKNSSLSSSKRLFRDSKERARGIETRARVLDL